MAGPAPELHELLAAALWSFLSPPLPAAVTAAPLHARGPKDHAGEMCVKKPRDMPPQLWQGIA